MIELVVEFDRKEKRHFYHQNSIGAINAKESKKKGLTRNCKKTVRVVASKRDRSNCQLCNGNVKIDRMQAYLNSIVTGLCNGYQLGM